MEQLHKRCFTSRQKQAPELVLPAHLYVVVLLRFGFQGIGTNPLGVPKFSLQVFFTFFCKTSFSAYSFLF